MSVEQLIKSVTTNHSAATYSVIEKLPLFKSLGDNFRQQLLDFTKQKIFPTGSLIIREGDFGAEMYVILDGRVDVFVTNNENFETILGTLIQGDYFGEQALLPRNDGHRTASVRAMTEVLTLVINKQVFAALLKEDHDLEHSLEVIGEKNQNQKLLQESVLLGAIPVGSDIREYVQRRTYFPGESVIREGEIANDIYLILEGEAEVYQTVSGKRVKRNSLGQGRYFGELAFINNEPRNATVVAKTPLRVLALNGRRFGEIYRQTPELNARFSDLNGFYKLPGEGFITLHSSKLQGMNAVTAVYNINSKAYMSITRVIGGSVEQPMCSVKLLGHEFSNKKIKVIKFQGEEGIYRELVFADDHVSNGVFYGGWDDLPFLLDVLLKGKKLHLWQRYLFEKEGLINLKKDQLALDDSAVICQCTGVTLGALKQAMQEGCVTAEQLADATGASRVCGGCAPLLKKVVGLSYMDIVDDIQIVPRTKAIRSIRLTPKFVDIEPYQVGQHIRVEGLINGQWVQRPYTLTSPTKNTEYYEITVKKTPNGLFSSWLHNDLHTNSVLRISKPEGGFRLDASHDECPYVCLVAGIGITPALSLLRSDNLLAKHQVYIDVSAREYDDVPCLDEVVQATREHGNLAINIRLSSNGQRIGQSDINQLTERYPDAVFLICGPPHYQDAVSGFLRLAGVDAGRTRTESFTPSNQLLSSSNAIKFDRVSFWLSVTLLILAAGFFVFPTFPYADSVHEFSIKDWLNDNTHRQISGYSALGLMLFGLIISLRKRIQGFKWGDYSKWRLFHIIVGSVTLLLIVGHTALSIGNNLSFSMFAIFMSLVITGIFTMFVKMAVKINPNGPLARVEKHVNRIHIWISLAIPAVLSSHILASYYF